MKYILMTRNVMPKSLMHHKKKSSNLVMYISSYHTTYTILLYVIFKQVKKSEH